ncbi:sigma-54-dependent Fis family transcriptional regulator [Geothermobacter hydrogeniphilus]|uniref:Sigma-54-dependent Fis family transcriptional regulator n=1 Tax=Geothermobacter hydrogeniphilus TaxID=1969733 RepID=A0A2K2H7J6_9BACT|nr:sigma 54-interacting transcriptional regulator [Geothermobacter hydrogeniphilus]PNU19278.1 sigma-54-dependent Fis family transcriptional regulator [Geothermobacter hydrogeniphilus]
MGFAQQVRDAGFDLGDRDLSTESWLVVLDQRQCIATSNEECFALIGKRPEEIIGRRLGQVVRLGFLHSFIVQGVSFTGQPIWIDGVKHFCDYAPLGRDPHASGGLFTLMRAEQLDVPCLEVPDLLCSMDAGSDLARESLILVNTEGIITMINQPFADVLGICAGEMLGKNVRSAYPNSNPSRLPVVMDTGQAEEAEPHLLNGRHAVVSRYPLFREGKMVGAWGKVLFSDVREISRLAEKFQAYIKLPEKPKKGRRGRGQEFKYDCNSIIGHSKAMKDLKEKLLRIAQRPSNVLLMGESGTGKELCAHAIHAASKRRYAPFVRVNCAAIPDHLLESELFGYAEGAFTGARKGGQVGKFEQADGGTIFLDEISDMPLVMQAKLLRVLQEREVTPLGSTATRSIDMRVVAATNVNLEEKVRDGSFRTDLYYRLNVIALEIPPLRERRDDIYFITKHLIDGFNAEFEMAVQGLDEEAWQLLRNYDFPGNIRELRNAIESAFNMVAGSTIRAADLPLHIRRATGGLVLPCLDGDRQEGLLASIGQKTLQEIMDEMERQLIQASLERVGGNKLNAANVLGISRPGLYKKLHKYNLQ